MTSRTEPDVHLVLPGRCRIERDATRIERGTVQACLGDARAYGVGIVDDDVDLLAPDLDPRLESLPGGGDAGVDA